MANVARLLREAISRDIDEMAARAVKASNEILSLLREINRELEEYLRGCGCEP